ncbi:hypothetical protein NDU88_006648 [Pleurodeles waltl]|uniref:Uncharacterized protein n=1 Tax=Pleurodeles waltl TaxID=8319 RepID=A0AAV7WEV3_PLEWA|nr:hypothetical protein NDU88_006648 [Pleurodeles waltl]
MPRRGPLEVPLDRAGACWDARSPAAVSQDAGPQGGALGAAPLDAQVGSPAIGTHPERNRPRQLAAPLFPWDARLTAGRKGSPRVGPRDGEAARGGGLK